MSSNPRNPRHHQVDPSSDRNPAQDYLDLCPVRTVGHLIKIDNVDFETRSFTIYSEMVVQAQQNGLRTVSLNLGKDVKIVAENGKSGVLIEDIPAEYTLNNVSKIESTEPIKSLKDYRSVAETHHFYRKGELIIQIPESLKIGIDNRFTIKMNVKVVNPKNGIHFHIDRQDNGKLGPLTHCYTYKTSFESNSSDWIPCFDDVTQFSVFQIEIRLPEYLTAQASGEHVDTIDNDDDTSTYYFRVDTPTPISNIGFAIGSFDHYIHPDMPDVMFLSLDPFMSMVKHTVAYIGRVFEFFEELLSSRFPFPCFHMLFVYKIPDNYVSYNGIALFPVEILYSRRNVDVVLSTRKHIVHAIASQFFGSFLQPMRYNDLWLTNALVRFMTMLYVERAFGFCEYIYEIHQTMKDVCEYENRFGKICLNPKTTADFSEGFGNQTISMLTSLQHFEMMIRKGLLVVRMIHNRIGKEPFMKVLHRLIYVATHNGHLHKNRELWYYMTISTDTFFSTITNVTGHELPLLTEQWINGSGHAHFEVSYNFNRKRNVIELTVKQTPKRGRQIYTGPLTIAVQEIDGPFSHTIQIDRDEVHEDLPCHSKARSKKKRKVMLAIGEETEMDFTHLDQDAIILWIRVDPDMCLIRDFHISQPLLHFEYMLQYERDIPAQLYAIDVFKSGFSAVQTVEALNASLMDERFFYQVRIHAVKALAIARTKFCGSIINGKSMIEIFQDFYGSKSVPSIVAVNNIVVLPRSLQKYALQKPFAKALAIVRDQSGRCPMEHVKFLSNLILFNDNSQNRFSDDFLRAAYVEALGLTLTPSENHTPTIANMSEAAKMILDDTTLMLNEEMMKPSYLRVIQVACLGVLCDLQCFGHLPVDLEFFWLYVDPQSSGFTVRIAAIMCMVKLIKLHNKTNWFVDEMPKIIDFIMRDAEPHFVYKVLEQLAEKPPFKFDDEGNSKPKSLPINSQKLFSTILGYMVDLNVEQRVRMLLFDLFYVLYGKTEPEFYSEPKTSFRSH